MSIRSAPRHGDFQCCQHGRKVDHLCITQLVRSVCYAETMLLPECVSRYLQLWRLRAPESCPRGLLGQLVEHCLSRRSSTVRGGTLRPLQHTRVMRQATGNAVFGTAPAAPEQTQGDGSFPPRPFVQHPAGITNTKTR